METRGKIVILYSIIISYLRTLLPTQISIWGFL